VDSEVTPGKMYYYVVAAVNEAGMLGLKVSGPPVKAEAPTGSLRQTGADTEVPPEGGTTTTDAVPPPPTNVVVEPYPYMKPTIKWQSSRPGARFLVERMQAYNAPKAGWERVQGPYGAAALWTCCEAHDFQAPPQTQLYYRVTAVDSAPPNYRSTPVSSKLFNNARVPLADPVVDAVPVELGGYRYLPNHSPIESAGMRHTQWITLNPAIASVEREGWVKGNYVGETYVIATGINSSMALQSFIWKVGVVPKP
jgi:hypothetical protein